MWNTITSLPSERYGLECLHQIGRVLVEIGNQRDDRAALEVLRQFVEHGEQAAGALGSRAIERVQQHIESASLTAARG
jgi:hypothetical protein